MVQDLEELGALPEEAAGGDEDREKEILMERIQSIKEEKQVSCAPFPPLSRQKQPLEQHCSQAACWVEGPDARDISDCLCLA